MSRSTDTQPRLVGGLWCQEVMDLLPELVEGSAPEAAKAQVAAHLAGCDWCARFGGAYGRTVAALGAGPVPDAVAARLEAQLEARINED